MYKLCKTEQTSMRQRRYELELLRMMKQRHYDEISVSDLCDRLQIPRKSFYRYFSGKDGALHALIDHALLELEEVFLVSAPDEDGILTQLQQFFSFWHQNQELLGALVQSNLSGLLIERGISHALRDYIVGQDERKGAQTIKSEYATQFAVCGLMSIVLRWHKEGYASSVEEMAMIARDIMNNPIYKN
jgi:AcrR family transcriptional regulator